MVIAKREQMKSELMRVPIQYLPEFFGLVSEEKELPPAEQPTDEPFALDMEDFYDDAA